jgi:hypothetical protein
VSRGELLCERCKLKDAIAGSSQERLTESSYLAGGPLPDCNYIKSFRIHISRIEAPHHTTVRSALGLIALGLIVLTFVFLTRHRSHACFTRFVVLSIMAGALNAAYNRHMHIILQGYCMRPLGRFLLFISSHWYCAATIQTIVYEGIVYKGIGSRHAKTQHHLLCRT